jgi:hypothetical protein
MAANGEVMLSGQIGHAKPAGYAASIGGVGLDIGEFRLAASIAEFVNCMQIFTHCQRHAGGFCNPGIAGIIIRNDRLFEPSVSPLHLGQNPISSPQSSRRKLRKRNFLDSSPLTIAPDRYPFRQNRI